MRLADKIFQRLKSETDVVFFVPGGSCMFLVDALGKSGIRHVSSIHEQGAGAMALGYAMTSGKLGVCLTISGAGATNAMTPCLAAWSDSIPVLFISGQARTDALAGNQDLRTHGLQPADIIRMVKPITKLAYQPESSALDCLMALDKMIDACMTGRRGGCWLSVPLDLQAVECG
jgi:acetolactate synthase I/II/III large subunit